MAENKNANKIAPSTVFNVEGSPDDYRYVLKGADLVLVNKETGEEQVFLFVGNIMSLDGQVNMNFSDGEALESTEIFSRSEMLDMEELDDEAPEWEVVIDTKDDSTAEPSQQEGNSDDHNLSVDLPSPGNENPASGQASVASSLTDSVINTQSDMLDEISSLAKNESLSSEVVPESASQSSSSSDNESDTALEDPDYYPENRQGDEDDTDETDDTDTEVEVIPGTVGSSGVVTKPTIELDDDSDTGVKDDDTTNETNPTFTGTADVGAVVKIYAASGDPDEPDTLLGTVKAVESSDPDADLGVFTYTLADGKTFESNEYKIYAVATLLDAVTGDEVESDDSKTLELTVDLDGPIMPTVELAAASDTTAAGVEDGNTYTNDKTPVLHGENGDAKGTLTIYAKDENGNPVTVTDSEGNILVDEDGNAILGTTTVYNNGSWDFVIPEDLADGTYSFSVTAVDAAGNESTEAQTVTLDNIVVKTDAPKTTLTLDSSSDSFDTDEGGTDSDKITNAETLKLNIAMGDQTTPDEISSVKVYKVLADDTRVALGQAQLVNGTWVFEVQNEDIDEDGIYKFMAEATDVAGNVEELYSNTTVSVEIDRTDPPNILEFDLVDSSDTSGQVIGDETDDYTQGESLGAGSRQLVLSGSGADNGQWVDISVIDKETQVVLQTFRVNADASGNWTTVFDSSSLGTNGTQDIIFRAEVSDAAGNTTSGELEVHVDQTAPDATSISMVGLDDSFVETSGNTRTAYVNTKESVSLTGLIKESGSDVAVRIYDENGVEIANSAADNGALGDVVISDTPDADGYYQWTYSYGALTDGQTYTFTAEVEDKAGNVSGSSGTYIINADQSISEVPTVELAMASNTYGGPDGTNSDNLTGLLKYGTGDDITGLTLNLTGSDETSMSVYLKVPQGTANSVEVAAGVYGVLVQGGIEDNNGTWPQVTFNVADSRYGIDYEGNVSDLEFVVVSTDKAGNLSTNLDGSGNGYQIVLDDADPVGSAIGIVNGAGLGLSGSDNETNAKEITLTGDLDEGADDVKVTVYDNGTYIGTAAVVDNGDGTYSWNLTVGDGADSSTYISEGDHSFTAVIEDNAGNETELSALDITIDRQISAPDFALVTDSGSDDSDFLTSGDLDSGNGVEDGSLTFSGSSDVNDIVTVFMTGPDGSTIEVGSFKATAEDWTYTISPDGTVSGTGISDSTTGAAFTDTSIDVDGDYSFFIETEDLAGNRTDQSTGNAAVSLTVDRTTNDIDVAPDLTDATDTEFSYTDSDGNSQTIGEDNTTSSSTLEFKGAVGADAATGVESGSTVTLYYVVSGQDADPESAVGVGSYTLGAGANSTTDWTISAANLPDGDYDFFITYTDPAGNVSDVSVVQTVTVDTSAPNTPTIAMGGAEGPDYTIGGDSDNVIFTNTQGTDFTVGNLEEGTTLVFSVDGTVVSTHEVSAADIAAGEYTFTHVFGADDDYTVSVRAVDEAGNVSTSSGEIEFTLDTDPGTINVSGLDNASDTDDTGNLGTTTDDYTSVIRPTIGGTAEAGSTVTLSIVADDGTVVKTVNDISVDSSGNWTYTIPPGEDALADDTYTVKASATDDAGNTTAVDSSYGFTVDTTVADVDFRLSENVADNDTGFSDSDGYTSNERPVFAWDDPGEDLTLKITVKDENGDPVTGVGPYTVSVADGADGSWALPASLADGSYTVEAVFEDKAGNTVMENGSAKTYTIPVTVDTSDPELTELAVDDSVDSGQDGDWLVSSDVLSDGSGNFNTISVDAGTGDTVITGHTLDADDLGLKLTGTSEQGSRIAVYVNDQLVQVDGDDYLAVTNADGTWTYDLSALTVDNDGFSDYVDGKSTNTVKVVVTDQAGNETSSSKVLVVDEKVNAGDIDLDDDSNSGSKYDLITDDTSPVLTGKTESGAVVRLFDGDSNLIGTVTADVDGNWSMEVPEDTFPTDGSGNALAGNYDFSIEVTDQAGNVDTASQTITLDFTPPETGKPTVELSDSSDTGIKGDNITNLADPVLTGTADPGTSVGIYVDDVLIDTVSVGDDRTFSYQLSGLTSDDYTVHVVASQVVDGETVTAQSDDLDLTVDRDAPGEPTVLLDSGSDTGVDGDLLTGFEKKADGSDITEMKLNVSGDHDSTLSVYLKSDSGQEVTVNGVTFKAVLIDSVEYDGSWPQVAFNVADAKYGIDYEGNVNELEFVVVSTDAAGNSTTNLDASDEGYKITLDDADPVAGEITLVDAAGLGISDADNETNAKEITLTGDLDEGAADVKVTLYDGGNKIGEATVVDDGDGTYSWSYTVGDDSDAATYIATGDHSFTAVVEDNAGNQTELSALDIVIDREISTPTFELATDTGISDTDGVTSGDDDPDNSITDGSLTFNGTSDIGDTVTVFMTGPDGSTIEVGTFKASSANWSYTISPDGTVSGSGISDSTTSAEFTDTSIDGDGDYSFYVETEDLAGNTTDQDSGNTPVSLTIDRTTNAVTDAPDLTDATDTEFTYTDSDGDTQIIGEENTTSASTLEFTGSVGGNATTGVEAGSTVTLYYVLSGQAADPETATGAGTYTLGSGSNSDTDWTISVDNLPEGDYDFFITYTDTAGNVSDPSTVQAVTVDTTAPATPTIDISGTEGTEYTLGGDSGNDIYTNTQATDFSVENLEAGTTLVFSVDGTVVATHEVTAEDISAGGYTFSHTFGADDDYTVSVRAVDEAGNVSTTSSEVELTLDTSAEAVTVSGIDTASDSDDTGTLGTDSDDYTNDTRPNIEGTAEAGSTVTLNIVASDGTVVKTVNDITADADGNWNYNIPDAEAELADGTYTVKVSATDYAGNTSAVNDAYSFTVDTVADVSDFKLEGTDGSSSANFTSDTSPVFEWTVGNEPDGKHPTATITVTGTTTDGVAYSKEFTVNGSDSHYGNWPLPEELADGDYTISASFEDAAGNTVDLDSVNFTVDTSAPSESENYEEPRLSNDSDTGEAGDWIVSSQVLEGQTGDANDLVVDEDSNTASVSEHTFDSNRGLELTGKADAGSTVAVYVNGQLVQSDGADSITVNADGTWSYNLSGLSVGNGGGLEAYSGGKSTNTIEVKITDQADNTSTFTKALVVDEKVDAGSIDLTDETNTGSVNDLITDVTNPVLTGSTEAGAVVQIFNWEGTLIETILADENTGDWTSKPITDFPTEDGSVKDGDYEFTIKVTDLAGNVDESSATITLDFTPPETAKPTIELTDESDTGVKGDDTTKLSQPSFEGTADPDATVDIYVDGQKVVSDVEVDADGNFTVDFADLGLDALSHGDHNVYAVAKLSDTVTSTSDIMGLSVDLVAPDLPTVELSSASDTTTGDVADGTYYTSDKTPTLQGQDGDPGSTLTVYYTGEDGIEHELGTTTVVGDGSWGYTVPTELADGTYSFRVTAVDTAGNESDPNVTSELNNVVVKTDSPMTSLSLDSGSDSYDADAGGTDSDKLTNSETITLNVGMANSTELSDVASVEIYKVDTSDGSRVSLGQATLVDGTWTFTVANADIAADGTYRFMAEATDVAGNVEALYSNTYEDVVIDRTAPETTPVVDLADSSDTSGVTIGDNADDYTQGEDDGSGGRQVVLNGSAAGANAWVDVYVTRDGSEVFVERVQADAAGNWTTTYDTTDAGMSGTEDLVFRSEISDEAGNTSSGSITVHVDQTAPVAASITMDGLIGEEKVEGSGKVATVQNESATLTGVIKESGDDVVVRLYQQNADGTYSEIANSSDSNGALGDVSISDGADGNYNWSYDFGNLSDGETYVFYAEVEDKAGNVSVRSDIYTVNSDQDINAPTIVLDESSNTAGGPTGTTSDLLTGLVRNGDDKITDLKLNVAGDSDSTLDVYLKVDSGASGAQQVTVNGVTFYGILVQGGVEINNGSWPQVTFDVSDSAYGVDYEGNINDLDFVVVATDKAENIISTEYSITLDDEPPVAGAIDLADSSDNGTSATDNITNADEIVISGHIDDPNVTVVVSDNGAELSGEITITEDAVNGGYKWEYTVKNADLGEGDHTFTATVQDNAGNTTDVSGDDALTVSIDRSIATPTFELVTDTGRISDDGITHGDMDSANSVADDSLTFSGTSDVDDIITVYMKNGAGSPVEVGRFTATSDSWSYTLNADGSITGTGIDVDSSFSPTTDIATDGDYTFYIETTDTAGNTATTYVDDKPVEVTIDRSTNDLSGNDEIDLATASDSAYSGETADGDFHTSTGDNVTNAEVLVFKGSVTADGVEAGSTVRLYYNNGTSDVLVGTAVLGEGETEWTITSNSDSGSEQYISEGTHDFFIQYEDLAGNVSNSSNTLSVTVDRTLPSTPSIAMDGAEGTDYHEVTLDGDTVIYTNDVDRTLTVSNLEEGTYLNIMVNGQLVTPAPQVEASGSYTFDPVSVLSTDADGEEYTITVTSVDEAGNESAAASFSYVLDTRAEAVSGVGLDSSSDSNDAGSLGTNFDNITNVTSPTIEGTAEPGSIVELRILDADGAVVKTVTGIVADATTGNWTYAYDGSPALTDGKYTVEGTATDYAGNEANFPAGGESAYSFTIDTVVADVDFRLSETAVDNDTGFLNTDGYTSNQNPVFAWDDPGEKLTMTVKVYDDNDGSADPLKTYTVLAAKGADGSWAVPDAMADGSYTITAEFEDAAGNKIENADGSTRIYTETITVDTTAPDLSVEISNNVDSGADNDWLISSQVLSDGNGRFNKIVGSGDSLTLIEENLGAAERGLSLSGGAEAGNRIFVYINGVLISNADTDATGSYLEVSEADGSWTFDLSALTVGNGLEDYVDGKSTNSVRVVAVDQAGNESEFTETLIVDSGVEAGAIEIDDSDGSDTGNLGDYITSDTTPTLKGETESGAVVQLYKVSADGTAVLVDTVTADLLGNWSVSVPESTFHDADGDVAGGIYTFRIDVTDTAGNVDSSSQDILLSFAPDEPEIQLLNDSEALFFGADTDSDFVTNATDPEFKVTVEENTRLVILRDGVEVWNSGADVSATTEYTWADAGLAEGTYEYTFQSFDSNGMSSSHTQSVSIDPQYADEDLTLEIDQASDTGLVNPEAGIILTKDATPTLSGKAEGGSQTRIYISDRADSAAELTTLDVSSLSAAQLAALSSVAVNSAGEWTISPTLGTTTDDDGYYRITIISEDQAGNLQTESIDICLDTTAPDVPSSVITTDLGVAYTADQLDNITDLTPRFEGIADKDPTVVTKVTIKDAQGSAVISFNADVDTSTGEWSYQVGGDGRTEWLSGGTYTVEVVSVDQAGNESEAETTAFTIDQDTGARPTMELLSTDDTNINNDGITSLSDELQPDGKLTLTGTAVAFSQVELYNEATGILIATVTAGENGAWTYDIAGTPEEGTYTYYVKSLSNGKVSDTYTLVVDNDTPEPTVELANDTGTLDAEMNDWVTSDPTLTGIVEEGSTVEIIATDVLDPTKTITITVPSKDLSENSDGDWVYTTSDLSALADGEYSISVTVTDLAGNTKSIDAPSNLVLDRILNTPSIGLASGDDSQLNDSDGSIRLNNDPSGTVIANESDLPDSYSSSDSDKITNVTDLTLTGTADPGAIVLITISRDGLTILQDIEITAEADGTWSYDPAAGLGSALVDGQYIANITVRDEAGNASSDNLVEGENTLHFEVDAQATREASLRLHDTADLVEVNGYRTSLTAPTLEIYGDAGSSYMLYHEVDGEYVLVDNGVFGASGSDSFTVGTGYGASSLTEGSHAYRLVTVDEAGNVQTQSYTVQVDLTAPEYAHSVSVSDASASYDESTKSVTLYTDDNTTDLTVSTKAGTSIVVLCDTDGNEISRSSVDSSGNANFRLYIGNTTLNDGEYPYLLKFYDDVDNQSDEQNVNVNLVVDTVNPATTIEMDADSDRGFNKESGDEILTSGNSFVFEGTLSELGVDQLSSEFTTDVSYLVTVTNSTTGEIWTYDSTDIHNQASEISVIENDGADTYSLTFTDDTMSDGDYTVEIEATDLAGNDHSSSIDFTVDNNDLATPHFDLVDYGRFSVLEGSYTAPDYAESDYEVNITYHDKDVSDPVQTDVGNISGGDVFEVVDDDKADYLEVQVTDKAGNESESQFIDLDTSDLDYTVNLGAEDAGHTEQSVTANLFVDANGNGILDGGETTVFSNETITDNLSLDFSSLTEDVEYTLQINGSSGTSENIRFTLDDLGTAADGDEIFVSNENSEQDFNGSEDGNGGQAADTTSPDNTVVEVEVHHDHIDFNIA